MRILIMRILFDTNVIIDAAVPSREHHGVALELIAQVDRGAVSGLIAPTSITTCWYVATARHGVDPRPLFNTIEPLFELALMGRAALRHALVSPEGGDFEDAYLAAAGAEAGAELVVTRNEDDFAGGLLRPYHPEQLAAMLRG